MSEVALEPGPSSADRLRRVHLGMIDAVLGGGGHGRVAELAAAELGGSVAIVLPGLEVAVVRPPAAARHLGAVRRYVTDRLLGRPAEVPAALNAEAPVRSGDERLGSVLLLDGAPAPESADVLALATLAVLTSVALEEGADRVAGPARARLLEDLRATPAPAADEVIVRARRLGCDLAAGAAALYVRPEPGGVGRVLAAIAQEVPGAIAAPTTIAGRSATVAATTSAPRAEPVVAALLPADAPARRLARRLAGSSAVGLSPVESDPGALGRALAAAELALVLCERTGVPHSDVLSGSWRVLLRMAVNDRAELEAVVDSALGPAVEHDRTSPAGLVDTLRAYLDHGANMNATAAAIYAHRHTIAYRLERVRDLTGHDPQTPQGQRELGLGLQALAVRAAYAAP